MPCPPQGIDAASESRVCPGTCRACDGTTEPSGQVVKSHECHDVTELTDAKSGEPRVRIGPRATRSVNVFDELRDSDTHVRKRVASCGRSACGKGCKLKEGARE